MSTPQFTMRQLLEAGVHFGHHQRRWNPKMSPYLFGTRNKIHIINLEKTVPMLKEALNALSNVVSQGGRVLFVGTKKQAQEKIAEVAERSGQYYVNHRWLGGMMTNFDTVRKSIKTLDELDVNLAKEDHGFKKKEQLRLTRKQNKLQMSLGGIRKMAGNPGILFVVDVKKEAIAIKEANNLNIPVIGIVDSNVDPDGVDFPIPGNDDATRAIDLYLDLACDTVLSGIKTELERSGVDLGAATEVSEDLSALEAKATNKAEKKPAAKKAAPKKEAVKATEKPAAKKETAPKKEAAKETEKPAAKKETAKATEKPAAKKAAPKKEAAKADDKAEKKPAAKKAAAKK